MQSRIAGRLLTVVNDLDASCYIASCDLAVKN